MEYIPNTPDETRRMLEETGFCDLEELYADVPGAVRLTRELALEEEDGEMGLRRRVSAVAGQNQVYRHIFMGAGAYRHFIPAAVDNLCSRNEFVTAYTPYQAEMSQGILQSIFEYQTMICELTGMDVANASVYDGASAAGEACLMTADRNKRRILVSKTANPQVIRTIDTYAKPNGLCVELVDARGGLTDADALKERLSEDVAGVYLASPNYYGLIEPIEEIAAAAHAVSAKVILGMNPIAAAVLKTAAGQGADIAVGDGQPLGLPLAFGGPYLGFMACVKPLMRKLPGRIVGQTEDGEGRRTFVLTLQAREQHIRREKAGSNICSNQAWCALRSAVYMSVMGKNGLTDVAEQCYANAHYLQAQLERIGFMRVHDQEFFHEFVTVCPGGAERLQQALDKKGLLGGYPLPDGTMLWCATELTGKREIDELAGVIREEIECG